MEKKSGFKIEKISNTFSYYSLISTHFFCSLALAGIACNLIKYIVGVARPKYFFFEGFERLDFFNIVHKANSFPSGHTQAAFTLAILVMIYFKKYHFFILCFAILMGISRIFMICISLVIFFWRVFRVNYSYCCIKNFRKKN